MSTITGWSFSEGADLFRGVLDCDGIGGIFTFLDHNILITIARVERFRDYATFSEILENHLESFLTKILKKDTKHKSSRPEVFCKLDILKNFVRFA